MSDLVTEMRKRVDNLLKNEDVLFNLEWNGRKDLYHSFLMYNFLGSALKEGVIKDGVEPPPEVKLIFSDLKKWVDEKI